MSRRIVKRVFASMILLPLAYGCASRLSNENAPALQTPQGMQQMEVPMQHMQELMGRIRGTEDPQERQRLMHEHMQAMPDGMPMMRRMMHEQRDEQTTEQVPRSDADEPRPDEAARHEEHH